MRKRVQAPVMAQRMNLISDDCFMIKDEGGLYMIYVSGDGILGAKSGELLQNVKIMRQPNMSRGIVRAWKRIKDEEWKTHNRIL